VIGRLKPYPEMKDSGVLWLGEVPEHWEIVPNRSVMKLKKEVVGTTNDDYVLLSLTKQGIITRDMENPEGKFPTNFDTYQVIEPGDLVFCLFDIDETPRAVGLSSLSGMITGAYTRFVCPDETTGKFVSQLYHSLDDGKRLKPLYSGLRKVIPKSRFLSTKLALPPPTEQAAIVRFLDHVDRQVRRYVRAKLQLIALLEEQNQAIIHRAVTRGLNPKVPLIDSGLPWCPQVPSHWALMPNRAFLRQRKVLVGERHPDFTLLSLTKRGVIVRDLSENRGKFSSDMGTSQEVRRGDLVLCLFDVPETPRTVGLSQHEGMITGAYTVFELRDHAIATWLEKFYIAMDDRKLLSPLYSGLRNTIPKPRFLGTKTPIPPLIEREAILSAIEQSSYDAAIEITRARREVDLLTEYRARLLADVVTGKLDVREAAAALPGADSLEAENGFENTDLESEADLDSLEEIPEEADA